MDSTKPIPSVVEPDAARDAERALGAGVRVGAFQLQAVIAESAASLVYLARDPALETQVAIKEYMPQRIARREGGSVVALAAHAEAYRRGLRAFHAAARTIARIDHPASPRALLLWDANDTAYLAMPYYPGTALLELRRGMRRSPDELSLRALLDGLLGALDAYHRRDLIHGDVGPSKILLLPDDRPLLLGPGSASERLASGAAERAAPFAAPEQLAPSPDAPLGPWTDLYALAAVLRFCITGELAQTARLEAETDVGERPPVYSAALLETLEVALSPQWERRPQSAQQFREWLARAPQTARASAARAAEGQAEPTPETGAAARVEADTGGAELPRAPGEPRLEPGTPARRSGVFTSPPRAQSKAQATLQPAQRPEPGRDKVRDDLRDAAWIEQRHGLPSAIEPGFDFDAGSIAPGDGREELAWSASGGSRRRRREVLLGSALLIVLAIGAGLFATNAWKSMLPVHVDMDTAPATQPPADPPPGPTRDSTPPRQRAPEPAAPQTVPGTHSESGGPAVLPAPIDAGVVRAAAERSGDPFPAPGFAAAPQLASPMASANPSPSAAPHNRVTAPGASNPASAAQP